MRTREQKRSPKRLGRELGLLDIVAVATGTMISSGFFLLPGMAAARAGPAVVLAYLLSGMLVIPAMLSKAELSTAMPRAGGTYFFISRSLGTMFGTIDGVGEWLALLLKCSIALVGLGAYLSMYSGLSHRLIASCFCVIFALVNYAGARQSMRIQNVMVVGLLAMLGYFILRGLPHFDAERLTPFAPFGARGVLSTAGFVFVSYIGLTKVSSLSEEVKNPERNLPLGMFLSLALVMLIYGFGVWVVVMLVPAEELHGTLTPLADAARRLMGGGGVLLITVAAALAFATTANAGLMSASRYLLAMGRDHVVPHRLARLSRYRTPGSAIFLTSVLAMTVVLWVRVEHIAELAATFQLLVFALINVAVIVMRESGISSYDPGFKSPLYPYMQILGIVVTAVLIPGMGVIPSVFAAALVGLGVVWFHLYVRHRVHRVGAVGKVAERVAERLLRRDAEALGLDKELREILKEKGLRIGDPFVELVLSADTIELGARADSEEVIREGSRLLAKRSGVSRDLILGALLDRSRLGETPADAGVALPHLLADEVEGVHMVIARSIRGIDFPMAHEAIHAIFLLLGSRKDPQRHLRILAEIARRAEDPEFLNRWIGAGTKEDLKDVLLSGAAQADGVPGDDD